MEVVGGVRISTVLVLLIIVDDYTNLVVGFGGDRLVDVRGKVARRRIGAVLKGPGCEHFSKTVRR